MATAAAMGRSASPPSFWNELLETTSRVTLMYEAVGRCACFGSTASFHHHYLGFGDMGERRLLKNLAPPQLRYGREELWAAFAKDLEKVRQKGGPHCLCCVFSYALGMLLDPIICSRRVSWALKRCVEKHRDAFAAQGVELDFFDRSGIYHYSGWFQGRTGGKVKSGWKYFPVIGFTMEVEPMKYEVDMPWDVIELFKGAFSSFDRDSGGTINLTELGAVAFAASLFSRRRFALL